MDEVPIHLISEVAKIKLVLVTVIDISKDNVIRDELMHLIEAISSSMVVVNGF